MNMQAIMRQAQNLQKDMLKTKEEIDKTTFEAESSFVKVVVNGKKELLDIKIDMDHIEQEDIEMLQDMILVVVNQAFKKVDDYTEQKMAKYGNMMPGMF